MLFLCLIPPTFALGEKKSTEAGRSTGVKNRSKVENKFFVPKGQLHYWKSSDWTGEAAIRTCK